MTKASRWMWELLNDPRYHMGGTILVHPDDLEGVIAAWWGDQDE